MRFVVTRATTGTWSTNRSRVCVAASDFGRQAAPGHAHAPTTLGEGVHPMSRSTLVALLAFLAFISLGLPDGLLGVS